MNLETIAAQMYTLREFTQTPEGLRDAFQKLKDIGYKAVQISGTGPIDPALVKQYADESGLQICATHVPWNRLVNDLDALAEEHKLWNCKYVGLGSLPAEYQSSLEGYRSFVKLASEIAVTLKEQHGLQFIYHNHDFEFTKFEGTTALDVMLQETDPESFGFELDLYWVQAGGGNPVDWVQKVEGRMGVVHLKDMAIVDRRQVFAEIGEGNMNYKAIVEACRAAGVEWFVVEQDVCRRNPFESLEISYKYLTSLL
ncbi:sugar phosphate isomerase/epimerase [Paenibacillus sp. PK3_47]|uniref:sugar phosphate isomerase/epimerase family protein n=1 Tax=Paenibacillus sp. PK3_47 TaxID=2072642 RepID=UPI00201D668D|nr:sugar phosphate isomerase/epimerase [Paenibacillus sp. PK3_47]UQZ36622.1 sugar phosphate isomerase/epimerase [Paenibacillus sp. PK3_47]